MDLHDLETTSEKITATIKELLEEDSLPIENLPAKTIPIAPRNAYYRSKLFTIQSGINPLVNAASPLLAMVNKLKNLPIAPDIQQLHINLTHEIKAFENKLQNSTYRQPILMAASYVICALIDEAIQTTSWGSSSQWQQQNLISTFQSNIAHEDKFFVILERAYEDPAAYTDLLELLYLCLSLGYEGKFRYISRGREQLAQITDDLYKTIGEQRGELSEQIFHNNVDIVKNSRPKVFIICLILLIVPALLFGIYCSFNFLLNKSSQTIYQFFEQFKKTHTNNEIRQ